MPYYRVGYDTNFCGVNEDKMVFSEEELLEEDVVEWAIEEVGVSPIFEEIDEDELEQDDIDFCEPWA